MEWEITFTTLGELPSVLLFLLHMYVYCIMGAKPMFKSVCRSAQSHQSHSLPPEETFDP